MKIFKSLLFLLIIQSLSTGCAIVHNYGEYYGKVIDTETKEPLEGAAVLAVYYTKQPGPGGEVTHYADAQETLTDKNGKFKILSNTVFAFRPLQYFDPYAYFTIFKPEYGCYPSHKGVRPMFVPNGTLPADQFVIIELPNVKNEPIEKRLRNAACLPSPGVPEEEYKELRRLLGIEYKSIGY